METKEEKEQRVLALLEADIKQLKNELKEVHSDIIEKGFTEYPILLAHIRNIAFGEKVIDKNIHLSTFSFSATTLEDIEQKEIIKPEKQQEFRNQLNSAKGKACIFLLHPSVIKFVFSPL